MSEKSKKTVCPSCGAAVEGNESKDPKKIFHILRGLLEDEEIDAPDETPCEPCENEPLETAVDTSVSSARPSLRERIQMVLGNRLINRLCVFVLAVCMLALAFAPFASYRLATSEDTVETLQYSGVDHVQISLLSMMMPANTQPLDTAGYDTLLVEQADEGMRTALLKQMILVTSVYARTGQSTTAMIAALLYVVYVLLCVIFVVMAGVNLATEFFTAKKKRHRIKKCVSDTLLCLLVCLLPVVCFCLLQACEVCTGRGLLPFVTPLGASLGWGAILSLVLATLGGIFVCAAHSVSMLRLNRRYFDRTRIKSLICIVLIVLVFVSTLLPCISVSMWDMKAGKEMTLGMNLWDIREMTGNEWLYYYNELDPIDRDDVTAMLQAEELPEKAGEELIHTMWISSGQTGVFTMLALMEIIAILTMICAACWLFLMLRRCFYGKRGHTMIRIFKTLTMLGVSLNFLFAVIIKGMLEQCLLGKLISVMEFEIGVGVIAMFIFALAGLLLRLREKRPVRYWDDEYDNADVSYAPYVLDAEARRA